MLDLGSGGGLTIEKVIDDFNLITAVEPFEEFSRHIPRAANIEIITGTIQEFVPARKYDIISLFEVIQYFSAEDAVLTYSKFRNFLNENGLLIVKQQFGVKENVVIAGYSEELQKNYFSEYRSVENEIKLLKKAGFLNVEIFDIYPPEQNRWNNTHHYALAAS